MQASLKTAQMSEADILRAIADTLHETFEIDRTRIVPEARLYEDLDIDSIDAIDLIVKLKPLIGRRMNPEAFRSVRTVGDVAAALHRIAHEG
jgi:acyl carrier protein